jgi:hypothetical protein
MKSLIFLTICFFATSSMLKAQTFSSGSSGADGALDLSSADQEIQLRDSGILNFTTVNIPLGRTLRFKRNLRNTPVIMLVQGNVNIAGIIDVSANRNTPGPGGFPGGAANLNGGAGPNLPGFGPGAGPQTDGNPGGKWIGPLSLVPIVGGSGGSGGSQCTFVGQSPFGGGGGGALVIASSQTITITNNATIRANGSGVECPFGGAGGGAGGAIRLMANAINAAGAFEAIGFGAFNFPGFNGVVRFEASVATMNFSGSSTPAAGLFQINPLVVSSAAPLLSIASIGGFPVPSFSGSRFDTYDMLLPNQLTDPIAVVVNATNIPVGTQVKIGFANGSPNATSTSATLAGTLQFSTGTTTISNLNRLAVTYLLATATFDPPISAMRFNPKGRDHVAKIRIESIPGAQARVVFLRSDGRAVDTAKLPKQFLEKMGL